MLNGVEKVFQFPSKPEIDMMFLSNGEIKTMQETFICGGLLGSILELNSLCGGDAEDLHKKDEEWAEKLGVSRDPET